MHLLPKIKILVRTILDYKRDKQKCNVMVSRTKNNNKWVEYTCTNTNTKTAKSDMKSDEENIDESKSYENVQIIYDPGVKSRERAFAKANYKYENIGKDEDSINSNPGNGTSNKKKRC